MMEAVIHIENFEMIAETTEENLIRIDVWKYFLQLYN